MDLLGHCPGPARTSCLLYVNGPLSCLLEQAAVIILLGAAIDIELARALLKQEGDDGDDYDAAEEQYREPLARTEQEKMVSMLCSLASSVGMLCLRSFRARTRYERCSISIYLPKHGRAFQGECLPSRYAWRWRRTA